MPCRRIAITLVSVASLFGLSDFGAFARPTDSEETRTWQGEARYHSGAAPRARSDTERWLLSGGPFPSRLSVTTRAAPAESDCAMVLSIVLREDIEGDSGPSYLLEGAIDRGTIRAASTTPGLRLRGRLRADGELVATLRIVPDGARRANRWRILATENRDD